MGSLLHWLKSSFTKVRSLQHSFQECFPLCSCIHISFIFYLQTMRSDFPYLTDTFSPPSFFLSFFFAACTYSSCILWGAATVLQPVLETGNWWMYVWKRASWSVSLRDRMWQWWSGAFAKLSGSVCFSVTCKGAWSVSVSPDSLCTKCKRSLWISKYYSSRIQDTGDLLVS